MLLLESPEAMEQRQGKTRVKTKIYSSYDATTMDISRAGTKKFTGPREKKDERLQNPVQ